MENLRLKEIWDDVILENIEITMQDYSNFLLKNLFKNTSMITSMISAPTLSLCSTNFKEKYHRI